MIQITDRKECTGCHACSAACPKECIDMVEDSEGFWYPNVREDDCIQCGLCDKICPIFHKDKSKGKPKAYAAYSKDTENRMNSSSGGIFGVLASYVLEQNGVVFGAGFDKEWNVCHQYIESANDLKRLQGSKYVQSRIGNTYKQAKVFLEDGRLVYFSGTPCQIEGLKAYLRKEYENLITQDIICHGVPSPLVWQKYIQAVGKKVDAAIREVKFRDKTYGWRNFGISVSFENKKFYKVIAQRDIYIYGFLQNLFLRPSCHACAFKEEARVSDITLADLWGSDKVGIKNDDKGISLIITYSVKAERLLEQIQEEAYLKEISFKEAIAQNSAMTSSAKQNTKRKQFFAEIDAMPIEQLLKKYIGLSFLRKVFYELKTIYLEMKKIRRKYVKRIR